MRKFNKNIFVFVICFVFIAIGLFSESTLVAVTAVKDALTGVLSGSFQSVVDARDKIDNNFSEYLNYHDNLMDINSLKENIINTRIVEKDDTVLAKDNSGYIYDTQKKIEEEEITKVVDEIEALSSVAKNNNSKFLYVGMSSKAYYTDSPKNVTDYTDYNYDTFMTQLQNRNIPLLNLQESFSNKSIEDLFFVTDHHWTPNTGFEATGFICEELNSRYGFSYNSDYCNINNYNIETYEDYFLGSSGKKLGTYFTWHGADNIDIITPKFDTDFLVTQPVKNEVKEGSFTETVMAMEKISEKDYYSLDPYATYGGGDFRLQIMKNNLNKKGKKVLLIRDSYAAVVAPFLSLNTSELHIVDVRNYEYFVGDKINVYDYIDEIKPDYVIVLYKDVDGLNATGRYDFE